MVQRLPSWRRASRARPRLVAGAATAAVAALAGLWAVPAGGAAGAPMAVAAVAPLVPAVTPSPATSTPPTTVRHTTATAPPAPTHSATVASRPSGPEPSAAGPASPPAAPAGAVPSGPPAPTYPDGRGTSHANSYSLENFNTDGSPVRFNPCVPIHIVTNLSEAPAGAASEVAEALSRLNAATGLRFVVDGSTTEVPQSTRAAVQSRYGNRWAPVLVAWSRHGESDLLPGGRTVGEGNSYAVSADNTKSARPAPLEYVTGQVVLDADVTAGLAQGFGAGQTIGQLLMHELGHVVGLGHTSDASQIMSTDLYPIAGAWYGAGDLTGLRKVGSSGGCLPPATAPTPS